jgi:hypothetical protein
MRIASDAAARPAVLRGPRFCLHFVGGADHQSGNPALAIQGTRQIGVILYAKSGPFLGDGPGGRAFGEDILAVEPRRRTEGRYFVTQIDFSRFLSKTPNLGSHYLWNQNVR